MKLYIKSNEQPFKSELGKGDYLYSQDDSGAWHAVYLSSWPKLKLGPVLSPENNESRKERSKKWKVISLAKGVTLE